MIDDPNVVLPLAISYNERGVAGYTHVVTNAEDQRKINCFYEVARNPMTGKGTLTLSKRPGVTIDASSYGTSSQDVYLVVALGTLSLQGKSVNLVPAWIINVSGGNIRASDSATSTNIVALANLFPSHVDKTVISSVENIVVQMKDVAVNVPQQFFYSAGNIAVWTQISDPDFTPLVHKGKMEFMDGFAFILDGATNRIYNSDSNSLANWTATSFLAKQIRQDAPVGLARLGQQLLAFSDDSMEVFYNAGNTVGSPLGRITQLATDVGLIPPSIVIGGTQRVFGHYYCTIGSRIFFLGRESGGIKSAGVFSYDGRTVERVSTPYIDKIFSEVVNTSFYSVNTVGFNGQKAAAFLLTSPNATSQRSLLFFPEWKEWFEWTSSVYSTINDGEHFLSCGTNLKNKLYKFDASDKWQDDSTNYQFQTQFRLPTNGSSLKRMVFYGVDADTDTGGLANTISVEASDNDCVSFYSLQNIDMTIDRKINFRGGSYTKRHMRLSATDSRPKRIHNFIANVVD